MTNEEFKAAIRAGIPDVLPEPREYDKEVNHAPKRKEILTEDEKKLALRNALRYFPKKFHKDTCTGVCCRAARLRTHIYVQIQTYIRHVCTQH